MISPLAQNKNSLIIKSLLMMCFMSMSLKIYARNHDNQINHIVTDLSLEDKIDGLRNASNSKNLDVRIIGMGEIDNEPTKRLLKVQVQDPNNNLYYRSGMVVAELKQVNDKKKWLFSIQKGCGSKKEFIVIIRELKSDCEKGVDIQGIKISKVIYENLRGWPVDLMISLGYFNHTEPKNKNVNPRIISDYPIYTEHNAKNSDSPNRAESKNENIEEQTLSLGVSWKKFPWDKYIRTRLDLDFGVSYVHQIPYIDRARNPNSDVANLLGYLEFKIGLNLGDILHHLGFIKTRNSLAECYAGLGIINHRSTLFGVFDDGYRGTANYIGTYIQCYI